MYHGEHYDNTGTSLRRLKHNIICLLMTDSKSTAFLFMTDSERAPPLTVKQ